MEYNDPRGEVTQKHSGHLPKTSLRRSLIRVRESKGHISIGRTMVKASFDTCVITFFLKIFKFLPLPQKTNEMFKC
jgi:hypothetical protein